MESFPVSLTVARTLPRLGATTTLQEGGVRVTMLDVASSSPSIDAFDMSLLRPFVVFAATGVSASSSSSSDLMAMLAARHLYITVALILTVAIAGIGIGSIKIVLLFQKAPVRQRLSLLLLFPHHLRI